MRRFSWAGCALAAALAAGCGGTAGDLMAVEVSGGPLHRTERILVTDDGRASCNGGALAAISNQQLLDAREDKRSLRPLAKKGTAFPSGRRGVRRFVFTSQDGMVEWQECASALPPAIGRITLLVLQLERRLCRR
jgi:hypothetical protein